MSSKHYLEEFRIKAVKQVTNGRSYKRIAKPIAVNSRGCQNFCV